MEQKLGPYRVISELGRGGMGVVYKGFDDALKRPVAIKVLGDQVAGEKNYVARFLREAQSAARLNHPNIVQIYYIGEESGKNFFVMEYVEGRSFQQVLRKDGRMEPVHAAELLRQAAAGLATAHDRGVIHRDIKPANLMLCNDGLVKIADFGLAFNPEEGTKLTATGGILGTPGYLSPEQCMAEPLDNRTDIFSLGISYYEMLSGRMPFKGDSPFAIVRQMVEAAAPEVTQFAPNVDADSVRILKKMIAKKREDRYHDCHQLIADLDAYLVAHGKGPLSTGRPTPVPAAAAARASEARAAGGPGTAAGARPSVATDVAAAPQGQSLQRLETASVVEMATTDLGVRVPTAHTRQGLSSSAAIALTGVILLLIASGTFAFYKLDPLGMWKDRELASSEPPHDSQALAAFPGTVDPGSPAGAAGTGSGPGDQAGSDSGSSAQAADAASAGGAGTGSDSPGGGAAAAAGVAAAGLAPSTAGAASAEAPPYPASGGAPSAPSAAVEAGERIATAQPAGSRSSQASSSGAPQVAVLSPREGVAPGKPRQAAPVLPAVPRVLVLGAGDPLLADALEQRLQTSLREQGLDVVDESSFAMIGDLRGRAASSGIDQFLPVLEEHGIGMVVLARVEPIGERMLSYMGRQEPAWTARVKTNVFLAPARRAVGPGWSDKTEYTTLTADRKAEAMVDAQSAEVAAAVVRGWDAFRSAPGR